MSLIENFKDRVPTEVLDNGAIRYEEFNSSGTSQGYKYFKRADEPEEVGNEWNKNVYDGIKSEFGNVVYNSSKATQAQAEAATDNTTWMTPLRTKQQILNGFLPSKQMSIATGTVSNNGTIPQTAGYSNYMYFVSVNDIANRNLNVGSNSAEIRIVCSVNQSTRKVTVGSYSAYSSNAWRDFVGGTANYLEFAWN